MIITASNPTGRRSGDRLYRPYPNTNTPAPGILGISVDSVSKAKWCKRISDKNVGGTGLFIVFLVFIVKLIF